MVQRYEQMRRLQWYKRGAAYRFGVIPHDFLTTLYQILFLCSRVAKIKLICILLG